MKNTTLVFSIPFVRVRTFRSLLLFLSICFYSVNCFSSQDGLTVCSNHSNGSFNFHDPITEIETNNRLGHVYRFSNVLSGVDAKVSIVAAKNAEVEEIDKTDGNPSGYFEAFQPVIHATNGSGGDHYIDFKIEFVVASTDSPYSFSSGTNYIVSGLDIDGPGNISIREYVGFKGFERYYLESPSSSNLDIRNGMTDGYTGFISKMGLNLPGVTVTETDNIVTAEYKDTNVFYYRAGVNITNDSSGSLSNDSRYRFFSLYFGCITYRDIPEASSGAGTLRYANSGLGKYKDRILFMDWKDSSLQDGIQEGDTVQFEIPESSCISNGKLTATFSDIDDPKGLAQHTKPTDMKTWVGSGFYKLYDTDGVGEAIYTHEFMLKEGESNNHLGFKINWAMEVDGETVAPDIFLIDAESTTGSSEQIDAVTNGGYWSVIENAQSNTYEVDGLGTSQVSIQNTEHPNPFEVEGWSPLLLSKGMTTTTINIKNFDSNPGKEGVSFGLLAPCDHGDAPATYGDAGHAFKEEPISAFKSELGLRYLSESSSPYLGTVPPDSELSAQSDVEATGDDAHKDFYDSERDDDEDGVSITNLPVGRTKEVALNVTGDGFLQAWYDWNADGDFEDLGEQIARDVSVSLGAVSLPVIVPTDAKVGIIYARFRISTQLGLSSSGYAKDGEVEDYVVDITEGNVCTINDIPQNIYTTSSVEANSSYLTNSTQVYQAKFNKNNWQGHLLAYDLKTTDDDGNVKSALWDFANGISRSGRNVFTYNPLLASGKVLGWNNLSLGQQDILKNNGTVSDAKKLLAWVVGSSEEEGATGGFRARDKILGDIVHSNLSYKGPLVNYGYKKLPSNEGAEYASFLRTKRESRQALFVGSNDGMLHALDTRDGSEFFSFLPNEVFPKLTKISDKKYGCDEEACIPHEYLVDGVSSVGDAYFDSSWHTVLVGTLGKGGKGIYALDITSPDSFTSDDILWEMSATQSANSASVYSQYMGYSHPAPSIVRMKNGKWAALIGNGYKSISNQAVLFIIDIETGELIKAINTGVGSETVKNGLSTPTAVDTDGDYIADRIYAGDLLGNLWSFDVSDVNPEPNNPDIGWTLSHGPIPLFRACESSSCDPSQVITAAPQVGKNPQGGLMVYFGTGKYFDVDDNMFEGASPAINTFYGIHDNGSPVAKTTLVQQSILKELSVSNDLNSRVTSANSVDFTTHHGWTMDLVSPEGQRERGERVISQALLREGRLIFTTMTPPQNDCVLSGKSWLMEFNALDGSRLQVIPFDTNNDKHFTVADNVDYQGQSTIISGLQQPSLGVIFSSPAVISHTTRSEGKYVTGTGGGIGMFRESASRFSGRMSWKQIR